MTVPAVSAAPVEMSFAELWSHMITIASAKTKEEFVVAFAAYAQDVVARETGPYEKIALFVHSLVEGQREVIAELMQLHGGGQA